MLGGALRGFNLLLVLAGLIAGTLIMHWRLSKRTIENLSAQRRLPTEAFACKPFRVRYQVTNLSRFFPAWMIRIEDQVELAAPSLAKTTACAVGIVAANQTQSPHLDCTVPRRGVYQWGPIEVRTVFPFTLFLARKTIETSETLHVFPALLSLDRSWLRQLTTGGGGASSTVRRSGASEGDFFGMREWKNGDSPKWIHWRTSARMNEPIVRQFEQPHRFDACFLVDSFGKGDVSSHRGGLNRGRGLTEKHEDKAHERTLSLAATLLVHFTGSRSNRLVVSVSGASDESGAAVISGESESGKRRMLKQLAAAKATDAPCLGDAIQGAMDAVGPTRDLIVLSPRSMDSALQQEPSLAPILSLWRQRGTLRWIDVTAPDVLRWVADPPQIDTQADTPVVSAEGST